jgi:hypothetical protein
MAYRFGFKWNVNEILALQREYELLEWSIQEIAVKHERTERAILCKLEAEGFISSWCDAKGYIDYDQMSCDESECDESVVDDDDTIILDEPVSEVDKLTERIWNLETNVDEIRCLVTQMLDIIGKDKKINSPKHSSRF